MLIKILSVAVITVIVTLSIKQYKPEIATLVSVCGGLIIFMLSLECAEALIGGFNELEGATLSGVEITKPIFKVLGVGYITEFTASLAEDAGNKSIASKVVLGGKIAICTLALPIIKQLVSTILSLI